ncbi:hypothetical protein EMIHUDRAFT_115320 [Emiliania huxleyi CCMP1516]|uniref:ADP,ATP carrier protein n=2 Tax=Emiliania huxleyi TaxID=2903 RepID=A0A0D3JR74_EMIH1|nr:hypothetical protein EMIHUDRAFT_115320 [Emiliania huxleyi CCMP1516]EOD26009.1 hypothetical protein EMIHUDRAFT_115320 [Emiliania huxleyi CCMP1516]|eukprot:XP_005778438.1 hypothetical protein EMIHUDRAFT_115320 [Emiliania huxleyi CCMP1516]
MGLIRFLYGELSHEALVQATFFSSLLCFIVGVYWMMRSLKDSVFASVVGLEYQPQAKMFSLVVVSVVLVAYNKIVDIVPRHRLFAVICGAYSALFVATAVMLTSTTHGLVGPDGQPIPPSPERWLGWIHYFAIESYGSLVVSLFWQYLNSQIGAITGCTLVVGSKRFGVPQLYGAGGLACLVSPLIVQMYLCRFPPDEFINVQPGLFEGLRLLIRHPYVLGIFAVSALFEVIATILDYQMKVLGKAAYSSTADFASFMGMFGQAPRLRPPPPLPLFPTMLVVVVGVVYFVPSMWCLFGVMVAIKGLSYALNNPSKEMLYMVTTDSIKFKAKSWIDVFGGRASKALGSVVTNTFKKPVTNLMFYGSLVSLAIALGLLAITSTLGRAFERLTASGELIGMDNEQGEEEKQPLKHAAAEDEESPKA